MYLHEWKTSQPHLTRVFCGMRTLARMTPTSLSGDHCGSSSVSGLTTSVLRDTIFKPLLDLTSRLSLVAAAIFRVGLTGTLDYD